MQHRPSDPSSDFGHFKNERLRFRLCVLREFRLAFEAVVSSKWLWLTFSLALGVLHHG